MEKRHAEYIADRLNRIAEFLAVRDMESLSRQALLSLIGTDRVDLLILLGGNIGYGCELAGQAYADGLARQLMIVGGEGHTTEYFRDTVRQKYPNIQTDGRMEADIIADMLWEKYQISKDSVLLESRSTNCGENAEYALSLAIQEGIEPKTVLLMHDSTMQRRIDATFRKKWKQSDTRFINYAAYRAQVVANEDRLIYENDRWGMWTMERYIALLLGEIIRLHDTKDGYGPNGKGYIEHVDVPGSVLQAYRDLLPHYGGSLR